ncbi:MAG TPA: ferrous iron transporter B [Oligoflexus sp.]|uniref:ferrous iron transporter B n=1 Tax=Oligoflexus sp. TaxID=1971216 RepID=UPI002D3F3785|nr:ferrous iron transporter B [Oligoflexus sp.]HYX35560.1 ferrous iron transporter B [Oligoflexus sp.]
MSETQASLPTLVLVGSPNCGKTALFNALTGLNHKVANYPGVTVDWAEALSRKQFGPAIKILDLPGTYSLNPQSDDELLTKQIIQREGHYPIQADVLVCVADVNHLSLHLRLVMEVIALGQPMVLAISMVDQAEKFGTMPDLKELEQALGIPVRAVSALKNRGLQELMDTIHEVHAKSIQPRTLSLPQEPVGRIHFLNNLLRKVQPNAMKRGSGWTDRIDRWLLHPWLGPVALMLVFLLIFQAIFSWASLPQDWIEGGMGNLGVWAGGFLPDGLLKSLIVDGLISGVGAVVVFLPQILILFFFLLILEDSGYMARAAFLLDRLMRGVGLNGRSVLPLVSGFACAIPSIMSTRIMGSRRERWVTILITPLMTCSARLPVYTLLISAFIPERHIFGFLNLQGFVLFALYVGGIASALMVAWVIQKFGWVGGASSFVMELPTYRWPTSLNVIRGLYDRGLAFLTRAGTFIMSVVIILWFLSTFPLPPDNATLPSIHYSFAGQMGQWLEPIFAPLGWNWKIVVALIPGFAAREVLVGALGMVYAIDHTIADEQQITALSSILSHELTLAAAVALLVWYVFAPQCFATFAVMQKETRSWRMTAAGFFYLLALAYMFAWMAHGLTEALA